jgi:hypothetical protein
MSGNERAQQPRQMLCMTERRMNSSRRASASTALLAAFWGGVAAATLSGAGCVATGGTLEVGATGALAGTTVMPAPTVRGGFAPDCGDAPFAEAGEPDEAP